jgi:hypothetical protein
MSKKKEHKFKQGDIVQTKMTGEKVQVMNLTRELYNNDVCYIVRFWPDICSGSLGGHKDVELHEFELEKKDE